LVSLVACLSVKAIDSSVDFQFNSLGRMPELRSSYFSPCSSTEHAKYERR